MNPIGFNLGSTSFRSMQNNVNNDDSKRTANPATKKHHHSMHSHRKQVISNREGVSQLTIVGGNVKGLVIENNGNMTFSFPDGATAQEAQFSRSAHRQQQLIRDLLWAESLESDSKIALHLDHLESQTPSFDAAIARAKLLEVVIEVVLEDFARDRYPTGSIEACLFSPNFTMPIEEIAKELTFRPGSAQSLLMSLRNKLVETLNFVNDEVKYAKWNPTQGSDHRARRHNRKDLFTLSLEKYTTGPRQVELGQLDPQAVKSEMRTTYQITLAYLNKLLDQVSRPSDKTMVTQTISNLHQRFQEIVSTL